ncbi:hypothetical protein [Planococcus sp. YIM B11945]|uniref:hypothetical protein n=1 Tax=Planococcus sp. YIM B11945 TaxID=3435410 RepID=UPI003D7D59CF
MTSRFVSAGNYLLDVLVLSLLLVFIDVETVLPFAFMWIVLSFIAGVASFAVFIKRPYEPKWSVIIAVIVMGSGLAFGVEVWQVGIFAAFTIYRLHMRFSVSDSDQESDKIYLLKFMMVFITVLFISLLNPSGGKTSVIYAIAIFTVSFYVAIRLLQRYISAAEQGAKLKLVFTSLAGILGGAAASSALVYWVADDARHLVGSALGGILNIVLWPFAQLMDKVLVFLTGLSTEQEKQETMDKLQVGEAPEQTGGYQSTTPDFPIEWFVWSGLIVAAVLLVMWFRKSKLEKEEQKKQSLVDIQHFSAATAEKPSKKTAIRYEDVDLHLIRETFRDFEKLAAELNQGRKEHETVREWIRRMKWSASDSFYKTYDLVRYGNSQVSHSQAAPFLNEIQELKEKYLKKDV